MKKYEELSCHGANTYTNRTCTWLGGTGPLKQEDSSAKPSLKATMTVAGFPAAERHRQCPHLDS